MKYFEEHGNLLKWVKGSTILFALWPLNRKVGGFKVFCYEVLWWFYVVFTVTTLPAFMYSVYYYYGDLVNFMKSLTELTYLMEVTFNFFWARMNESQLRILITEIEEFEKVATPEQKILRRKYVKSTSTAYPVMMFIFIFGACFFVFAPVVVPTRRIPLNTIFPFPVEDKFWAKCLVYGLNNVSIITAISAITVDLMVIMMIWFASFKFASIATYFRRMFSHAEFRLCVIKHQAALRNIEYFEVDLIPFTDRYAKGIENSVRSIVLKSTVAVSVYMIACTLLILNNVAIFELTQFILITFLSSIRLFMVSWSANVMTDIAYDLAWAIYDSPWINCCGNVRKGIVLIIMRAQIPVAISVAGVVNAFSLEFCALVFYKVFSYFMTLRVILKV